MPFLPPNQQRQSTEGIIHNYKEMENVLCPARHKIGHFGDVLPAKRSLLKRVLYRLTQKHTKAVAYPRDHGAPPPNPQPTTTLNTMQYR